MLILTGKIVVVNKVEIVNKSNNEVFHKVYLVVNKQMNKVKRNICFESYGKIANNILTYRKGQRVRIHFTIDSTMNGTKWFHTLKVVDIEPFIKMKKTNNGNQINLINTDYDTT